MNDGEGDEAKTVESKSGAASAGFLRWLANGLFALLVAAAVAVAAFAAAVLSLLVALGAIVMRLAPGTGDRRGRGGRRAASGWIVEAGG